MSRSPAGPVGVPAPRRAASRRAAWLARAGLAAAASPAIGLVLRRYLGWHPAPPSFRLDAWPVVGPRLGGRTVELLWPRVLWAAVLLPGFALVVGASLADLPRAQRWLGVGARSLLALTLLL